MTKQDILKEFDRVWASRVKMSWADFCLMKGSISKALDTMRDETGKALWKSLFPDGEWTRPTLRPIKTTQLNIKEAIENLKAKPKKSQTKEVKE